MAKADDLKARMGLSGPPVERFQSTPTDRELFFILSHPVILSLRLRASALRLRIFALQQSDLCAGCQGFCG
jgi:hypothetical protein